jgi:hypothetical protein
MVDHADHNLLVLDRLADLDRRLSMAAIALIYW